jgi:hypothetical protein
MILVANGVASGAKAQFSLRPNGTAESRALPQTRRENSAARQRWKCALQKHNEAMPVRDSENHHA